MQVVKIAVAAVLVFSTYEMSPGEQRKVNYRRVEYRNDLVIPTGENIMVVDNSCDQSIIDVNSFLIKSFSGELFNIGGTLYSMHLPQLELTLMDNLHVIFKLN